MKIMLSRFIQWKEADKLQPFVLEGFIFKRTQPAPAAGKPFGIDVERNKSHTKQSKPDFVVPV